MPSRCGFPFPSSVYFEDDAKTATGKHVVFRSNTLPLLKRGLGRIDPVTWIDSDGFSSGQVR